MSAWHDGIDGTHREVAGDTRTPIHVLAGPGTGKTFAMIRRVARILGEGCPPEKILAVSFTRTAARDIREQLGGLGIDNADSVRASTLHSLCYAILARQEVFEMTGRSPRPLLSYELDSLVEDLADKFGGKRVVNRMIEAYESAWARLQHEETGAPKTAEDLQFEAELLNWMRFHECMLIGELVPLTLNYIRNKPGVSSVPEFQHVLVDEYQDLNKADQMLVRHLATSGSLLVIGDDSQSIYSFRYANPEGIRQFPNEVTNTVRYDLDLCRRCPPNIVEMSNSLIAYDTRRSRNVPLRPDNTKQPANVWIVRHAIYDDEVESVADYINNYLPLNPKLPPDPRGIRRRVCCFRYGYACATAAHANP